MKLDLVDDLQVLDGIGPKIDAALKAAGVKTYSQVAGMTPDQLRELLRTADVTVIGTSIETWPHQAKLTATEDWPGLIHFIIKAKSAGVVQ